MASTAQLSQPCAEWSAWRVRMWDSLEARFGRPGLAFLEQIVLRSKKETRCADCGDAGTVKQPSGLIQSVSHYWLCGDCHAHYQAKR